MTAIQEREDVDAGEDTRERVLVWDTKEVLYVHPVASLFPMMSDEELDDLAEDIRRNGQADPIVLDQHRQLIDGRNRLAACGRARVSPDIIDVSLDDPVAYILSKNVTRRHLSKGQQAMAVAKAGVLKQNTVRSIAAATSLSAPRLQYARAVLEFAPHLVDVVLEGQLGLDEAYRAAQEAKRLKESAEETGRRLRAEVDQLRSAEPDLADLVGAGLLKLEEAKAAAAERRERDRQKRKASLELFFRGISVFDPGGEAPGARAEGLAMGVEMLRLPDGSDIAALPDGSRLTEERLRGCVDVARALYARLYGGAADAEAQE